MATVLSSQNSEEEQETQITNDGDAEDPDPGSIMDTEQQETGSQGTADREDEDPGDLTETETDESEFAANTYQNSSLLELQGEKKAKGIRALRHLADFHNDESLRKSLGQAWLALFVEVCEKLGLNLPARPSKVILQNVIIQAVRLRFFLLACSS
jgi:hypothetical protein